MADFKVGDVVRLKSGGPKMTVSAWTNRADSGCGIGKEVTGPTDGLLFCLWYAPVFPNREDLEARGQEGKDNCYSELLAGEFSPEALKSAE